MAITTGRSPIIMDAVFDNLATVFQGRDMQDTTPVPKVCVSNLRYVAGGPGSLVLLNKPGGTIVWESRVLNAGEAEDWVPAEPGWFDGLYILQMPAGGRVYVYSP